MALTAFFIWGFSPIYYRAIGGADALEILAHRAVWSFLFCLFLLLLAGEVREFFSLFQSRKKLQILLFSSVLVSVNWLTFIWAVNNERALEASMGYFIFPIVMVFLGGLFLGERLNRHQIFALLLVIAGVLNMLLLQQQLPWIALLLAGTMGLYSLVRKMVPVGALLGLTMECMLLTPIALFYLYRLQQEETLTFGTLGLQFDLLLIAAALITALPLLLFTSASKQLRLGTLGLIQYINPTCQFLLAVLLFGEAFTQTHLHTFLLIWSGLLIFTLDIRCRRQRG